MNKILAVIPTKGRYKTTLPLTLLSVISQTRKPDFILIIDDGEQLNLNEDPTYKYLFSLMGQKKIPNFVLFGERRGQHYSHQASQNFAKDKGYNLIWRIDDDEVAEPDCLKILEKTLGDKVMAVAGLVLDPIEATKLLEPEATNSIKNIDGTNIQWHKQKQRIVKCEHLYSSFLYRPYVARYNLALSPVAHREETLFTHELSKHGDLLVNTKAITWHFRNPEGGIRTEKNVSMYSWDDEIFREIIKTDKKKIVVLDCGLGDTICFNSVIDEIKPDIIACCYPEVFKDFKGELISIAEAIKRFGDLSKYSIYPFMDDNNWNNELQEAFKQLYK